MKVNAGNSAKSNLRSDTDQLSQNKGGKRRADSASQQQSPRDQNKARKIENVKKQGNLVKERGKTCKGKLTGESKIPKRSTCGTKTALKPSQSKGHASATLNVLETLFNTEVIDDGIQLGVDPSEDEFEDSQTEPENSGDEDFEPENSENSVHNLEQDQVVEMAKIVEHNVQPNQYNNNSTNLDDRQKNGLAIDNEEDAMKYLTSNPFLEKAMKKMIQQSIAEENTNAAKGKSMVTPLNSPQKGTDVIPVNVTSGNKTGKDNTLLKSPSDTTLYAPALRKLPPNTCVTNKDELIDRISNFVEEIHFEGDEQRRESGVSRRKMPDVRPARNQTVKERIATTRPPQAQRELMEADRLVIEAEQFNATVEAPKGNNNTVVDSIGVHKMRVVMTITSTSHVMLILFYIIRSKGVNSLNLNVCYPKGVSKRTIGWNGFQRMA